MNFDKICMSINFSDIADQDFKLQITEVLISHKTIVNLHMHSRITTNHLEPSLSFKTLPCGTDLPNLKK